MGFLQGPVPRVNRHTPGEDVVLERSFAAIVPMAADDADLGTAHSVITTLDDAGATRIVLPVRGSRSAVQAVASTMTDTGAAIDLLWCNGPKVESVCDRHGLHLSGKGSDVWLALGPAADHAETVVCVDADARTLTGGAVRRLVAPLDGSIQASKAWYTRIENDRLYGRLCRLLARPLILALDSRHDHELLSFLRSFRYPLSGEIAIDSGLADELRLPAGMGLEIGTLGELYRLADPHTIAQVDLGNHRHDHRPVTGGDGLVDLAPAVTGALAAILDAHADLDLRAMSTATYTRWAEQLIDHYARDARINGLEYDRRAERRQVDRYREAVADPAPIRWMPAWSSVDLTPETILEVGRPPEITSLD